MAEAVCIRTTSCFDPINSSSLRVYRTVAQRILRYQEVSLARTHFAEGSITEPRLGFFVLKPTGATAIIDVVLEEEAAAGPVT